MEHHRAHTSTPRFLRYRIWRDISAVCWYGACWGQAKWQGDDTAAAFLGICVNANVLAST